MKTLKYQFRIYKIRFAHTHLNGRALYSGYLEERKMKTVAGIDMGTQSMKVILYDYESKMIVASAQEAIDLIAENDGTREQKVEWYDEALKKCFSSFSTEQRASIAAIGVSGHQHGFVPLDADAKPLYNLKLLNDTSTVEECRILTEAAGGTMLWYPEYAI